MSYEIDKFFDLSMDLLCIAGDDGYFKRLNPAWERALGFSREELCSKPFIEFIHPDDRARTQDVMEKLSRGQPAINFENRYRCRDGSYRWLTWITPAPEQDPPVYYAAARDITEHKQMEEALRQANDELEQHVARRTQELATTNAALRVAESWQRALIGSIQGIVWECDARTWKFSFVSHQAELVLGYPVHRWLDEPDFWPAHIHQDDRNWVMEYCLASSREKRKYSFEYRMIAADGRTVWLQNIVTVEIDELGPAVLRGIMVDITERKQTEAALRDSEARFRSLFEEVPIAYQSLDIEGRYLDVNKGLCTLLGYSPDELLGKPFDDFWPLDARELFPAEFGSFKRNGGGTTQLRLRRKDGGEIVVILEGRVQRDLKGNFLRTHCILTDITDQKHIEENLRRSEVFITSVLENLPNMIFVKETKDLRIVRFNKAGEELLGYRRDELLGKNAHDIFPKEEADFFTAKDREVLRSGRLLDIPEEPIQTKHNGVRFLHTKKIPICSADGTPQYLLGISEDITERKQAEEALRQNEARLNAAQRIAHIGSWELDLADNVLTWSDEIYRIFEIDPEKFGASYAAFLELVHPDDRQLVNEGYIESVANRTNYNIEHRLLMYDGRVKFVQEQCETFYAPDGRPTRSIGTVQDITERKRVEEALREQLQLTSLSAQLHAALIQGDTLHGMLDNCADTLVRQLNLALARIWLLGPGDLCDTCCKAAHCADRTRCLHLEASAGLSKNLNGEYRRIPLGAFKIGRIAMVAGPIFTNDVLDDDRLPNKQWLKDNSLCSFAGYPLMVGHDLVGVMAVFARFPLSKSMLDALETASKAVTLGVVRKRTEEALETSDQLLWVALEEREQLSQDLHDNIIQAVYAIGMSLEECRYLFQEDRAEAEKKLAFAVASLNGVISDVRTYIVWNKHKEITGQQLCAKLAELAVNMESAQGIHFSLDLAVEAAQRLTPLGAFHILHIVQEAMSNSLRHSKSRSGLVSLQMEGRHIRLEIRDDGVGFNIEEVVGQGHGLQNMTARAQKLGADIQIVSKPGLGVQILVELPWED